PGFQAYRALITHNPQGGGHGRLFALAAAVLAPAPHVLHLDLADHRPRPPDQRHHVALPDLRPVPVEPRLDARAAGRPAHGHRLARGQILDGVPGPVPDLRVEAGLGDPLDPFGDRQVEEHHLGAYGQSHRHAPYDAVMSESTPAGVPATTFPITTGLGLPGA